MKKKCYIFAAGDYCGKPDIKSNDYIITADAGYLHAKKLGITPNLAIGDFDSLENIPNDCEVIRLRPEKDDTDTSLACDEAIKRGYNDITVCGAIGGERFDHTFSNIQTAHDISLRGADIMLTDGITNIKVISNTRVDFDSQNKGYISIFSLSECSQGVDISGLKYTLENATLISKKPLGVSNEFCYMTNSFVSVKKGTLAIVWKNKHLC